MLTLLGFFFLKIFTKCHNSEIKISVGFCVCCKTLFIKHIQTASKLLTYLLSEDVYFKLLLKLLHPVLSTCFDVVVV